MDQMTPDNMPMISPAFEKAATQAITSLAIMQKESHKVDPASPMNDALNQLQMAVAEIEASASSPAPQGEAPMDPGAEAMPAPEDMAPLGEDVPPPPPPDAAGAGNPFQDAAGGLKNDMMAAAKKRAG